MFVQQIAIIFSYVQLLLQSQVGVIDIRTFWEHWKTKQAPFGALLPLGYVTPQWALPNMLPAPIWCVQKYSQPSAGAAGGPQATLVPGSPPVVHSHKKNETTRQNACMEVVESPMGVRKNPWK